MLLKNKSLTQTDIEEENMLRCRLVPGKEAPWFIDSYNHIDYNINCPKKREDIYYKKNQKWKFTSIYKKKLNIPAEFILLLLHNMYSFHFTCKLYSVAIMFTSNLIQCLYLQWKLYLTFPKEWQAHFYKAPSFLTQSFCFDASCDFWLACHSEDEW